MKSQFEDTRTKKISGHPGAPLHKSASRKHHPTKVARKRSAIKA